MIWGLISEFWPQITGGLALVAGALFGRQMIIKGERDRRKLRDANDYIETSERIHGVDPSGDDAEWLRERAKK